MEVIYTMHCNEVMYNSVMEVIYIQDIGMEFIYTTHCDGGYIYKTL